MNVESEQRRISLINEKQNLLRRSDSTGDLDVEKMMERRRQAQIEADVRKVFTFDSILKKDKNRR